MGLPLWLKDRWKEMNANGNLPIRNVNGALIVIGCNYHTTWQTHKQMRFVLTEIKGNKARLQTRTSRKRFLDRPKRFDIYRNRVQ